MAKIKKVTTSNAGENMKKLEHSYIAGRNIKWCNHSRKQFVTFFKTSKLKYTTYNYQTTKQLHSWAFILEQ